MSLPRHGIPYLAIAVATSLLLLLMVHLPLSRLDVAYAFGGDAMEKLAQIRNVAETGWLFHSDRLGYPFGYDRLDFPRFDSLNYVLMGPLAAISGEAGLAMNLYYIAGFYLIAFAAFWSLRRIGMQSGVAALGALLYAFLPYHVLRGVPHLTNGAYFLVPLAMSVLVRVARGDFTGNMPGMRSRWLSAIAVALLIPLQTPYNGVFFAFLCLVAGAIAIARRPQLRAALPALVLIVATAVSFCAEQVPVLLHAHNVGTAVSVADRLPQEAEVYALHLNQVLLPPREHRVVALAQAKRRFDMAMGFDIPYYEVRDQYIGAFGVFGFGMLLWSLARAGVRRESTITASADELESNMRILALMAICVLLLAMSSGLGNLVAVFVTTKIRAYNRILPFLAFPCLAAGCWALQSGLGRIGNRWWRTALLAAVGLLALYDTVLPQPLAQRNADIASFDRDRAYFAAVEQHLGAGAALFELPVVWYPEHPPVGNMTSYEEFRPFLLNRSLRTSYGSALGRRGYSWGMTVAQLPPEAAIAAWRRAGFSAVLVDARAYPEASALAAVVDPLSAHLAAPPLVSDDKRWWTLPLSATPPTQAPDLIEPVELGMPIRFRSGERGGLYQGDGWAAPESWGTWSLGRRATLLLRLAPVHGPLMLEVKGHVLTGPTMTQRHLRLSANGTTVADIDVMAGAQTLRFPLPEQGVKADGLLRLEFDVTPEASPRSLGLSTDGRHLGIGLQELTVTTVGQE
jgi:phosphoglycerol transferase